MFIAIAADLDSHFETISEVPAGATWFSSDGRPPQILSLIRAAALDEPCGGVGETCAHSTPGSADEGQPLSFPVAKAGSFLKDSEVFGSKRGCGPSFEGPEPGRSSGDRARPRGRICWQAGRPRSQWSCAHSNTVQFRSCDVGDARCLAKVGEFSTARSSHSAWDQCWGQAQSTPRQASWLCPVKKRCALPVANPSGLT